MLCRRTVSRLLQLKSHLFGSDYDQLVKRLRLDRLSLPVVTLEHIRKLESRHRPSVVTVVSRLLNDVQNQLVFVGAGLAFKEFGFNQLTARQQPVIITATHSRTAFFIVLGERIAIVAKRKNQKRRAC
jgi:hypothetical protein